MGTAIRPGQHIRGRRQQRVPLRKSGGEFHDRGDPAPSLDTASSQGGPVRLAAVDGLRLIAAVMVAAYHFLGTPTPHFWGKTELRDIAPTLHQISGYGWLGVEFFFIISGFVICMSCWGRTPAQFAVSRVSRLFPAYWVTVLLVVVVVLIAQAAHWPAATTIDPRTVLGNLTMVPGPLGLDLVSGVSWTLWVEARFYLLMAVLLLSGLSYSRIVVFCAAWLFMAVIALELHSELLSEILLTRYAGLFISGIVLYLMRRFGQSLMLWLLLAFAWCYELTLLQVRVAEHTTSSSAEGHVSWMMCASVLTACGGLVAVAGIGPLAGVQWGWLITAGGITYPFYLVHQSIGVPLAKGLLRAMPEIGVLTSVAVALMCMLILAALIHRWVERSFGSYLRHRLMLELSARHRARASTVR